MDNLNPQALCLRFLMGESTEQEVAELDAWIAQSPDNAERFALLAVQDASLTAAAGSVCAPGAQPNDIFAELSALEAAAGPAEPVDLTEELSRRRHEEKRRSLRLRKAKAAGSASIRGDTGPESILLRRVAWLGFSVAAAAVVGVAVTLFYQAHRPTPGAPSAGVVEDPELGHEEMRRRPVARLQGAHEPVWVDLASTDAGPGRPGEDGRLLQGRYALASGAVEVRLDYGAVMLVEGPAEFEVVGKHASRLISGRLTVDATTAIGGFRLETPTALAQDLGAGGRFGLAVDATGQTQTHVYAGQIDFSNLAPNGRPTALRLSAHEGAVVSGGNTRPRLAVVAREQFAMEMSAIAGMPLVTGQADYLRHMPASVVMNRGPQSPRAWVALESTGRPLQRGTAWAQSYPSDPSVLVDPEGRVVDSYLVVFDPADETLGRFRTVEFTLTFPSEVMTIITQNKDLAQSHGWYGTEATRYEELGQAVDGLDPGVADGDAAIEPADSVSLSGDGRTLRVSIRVGNGADVFRVLILREDSIDEGRADLSP